MHAGVRPYLSAGIALVGAGVIATAPVNPPPQIHSGGVELAAAVENPVDVFAPVFELASQRLDVGLRLMIVVVTQLTPEEVDEIKGRLTGKRFPDSPVNIDIHFFDFEELQRTYVTDKV